MDDTKVSVSIKSIFLINRLSVLLGEIGGLSIGRDDDGPLSIMWHDGKTPRYEPATDRYLIGLDLDYDGNPKKVTIFNNLLNKDIILEIVTYCQGKVIQCVVGHEAIYQRHDSVGVFEKFFGEDELTKAKKLLI
jgi:hypothetical protein